jgi:2-C-methyl-D-erythritol 4-phosphate cytidylyltransferase/2-C-methyl-D-erythritol 2,4-cyclodiphosphate synthase
VTPAPAGILVAAGASRRMGHDKLWIDLFGRPVWRWSLDLLLAEPSIGPIVVAVPEGAVERFAGALPPDAGDRCRLTVGGATRAESVLAALDALAAAGCPPGTPVLIHDAARPAAGGALVRRLLDVAAEAAAAVPGLAVRDSLKEVVETDAGPRAGGPVDRDRLIATQTPQLGRLGQLQSALRDALAGGDAPTDDAGVLAAAGVDVRVVAGDPENIKLTDPADLPVVAALLGRRAAPLSPPAAPSGARTGIGFDAHRLEPGRPLRLGGVAFPDAERGLAGHSDGDVALHAVIDALLGAAGAGDVGRLFPAEPAWRDADSARLLQLAVERVAGLGWRPSSLDLVIVAASPPVAPRAAEMAARIGALVAIDASSVSVKGTTSDSLGFAGSEGIAAYAAAVVVPAGE